MKMIYGGVPVNSLKVKHFELNTNGATAVNSAVQAGLTYFANGRKEVGTGKSFEFASYGNFTTNESDFIPSDVNVINISSLYYPIQISIALNNMCNVDFSSQTKIGDVLVDGTLYPIYVEINNHFISIICDKTIDLQIFMGKDNYI